MFSSYFNLLLTATVKESLISEMLNSRSSNNCWVFALLWVYVADCLELSCFSRQQSGWCRFLWGVRLVLCHSWNICNSLETFFFEIILEIFDLWQIQVSCNVVCLLFCFIVYRCLKYVIILYIKYFGDVVPSWVFSEH